jgi:sugar phosphate isomerase/epimerase
MTNLGVFLELRTPQDIDRKTQVAHDAGYNGVQVYPPTLDLNTANLTRLAHACASNRLAAPILSPYCDLLKPDAAPMGFTLPQAEKVIEWMQRLGATGFVVWSGTLAPDLLGPHSDNRSERAWSIVVDNTLRLLDQLERINATLLIEPYFTHIIGAVEPCLELIERVTHPLLKFVLDPPNMIPPEAFADQREHMRNIITQLAPHIGLVHFKDARLTPEGGYDFPGAGQGDLDYAVFTGLLKEIKYDGWLIVEHVDAQNMFSAGNYVHQWLQRNSNL